MGAEYQTVYRPAVAPVPRKTGMTNCQNADHSSCHSYGVSRTHYPFG